MKGSRLWRIFTDARFICGIYMLASVGASIAKYLHGGGNNLRIFRSSFFNLIAGNDLYALHPGQHFDYFKYSPTFALFFAPFAAIPEPVSAVAWNLCNALAIFAAVQCFDLSREQKAAVLWLILLELIISLQNFQSNGVVAALILATFVAFECGSPVTAALFVALGGTIKIFGAAAGVLFIFYPRKARFLLALLAAALVMAALPLFVTSPAQLHAQYQSWFALLRSDYLAPEKLSVMSWLHAWFGFEWPNAPVQIAGGCFLLLPLLRHSRYADYRFRLQFVASLLIFLVIFNHKAESPMFILAVTGAAIWFVTTPATLSHIALMALMIALTSIASTDVMPRHLRQAITTPLVLKTLPCIVTWLVIEFELLWFRKTPARASA